MLPETMTLWGITVNKVAKGRNTIPAQKSSLNFGTSIESQG